jgi:cytochrome b561
MPPVDFSKTEIPRQGFLENTELRLPHGVEALFEEPRGDDLVVAIPAAPLVREEAIALRYDAISMTLHWVSALIVLSMFATGWTRSLASSASTALLVLTIHRSTGVLLWTLTLARLVWKLGRATQPPLPTSIPPSQRLVARLNEWLLYGLLLAQPASGLGFSVAIGKSFVLMGWRVPILMERDPSWMSRFESVHEACGVAMAVLVGVHAIAAIHHHFIKRDNVLRAMLPHGRSLSDGCSDLRRVVSR